MMGARSRTKGHAFERAVAAEFRTVYPEHAEHIKRGLQGRDGSDVPDVVGVPGLWIECKHGKKLNFRAALKQAVDACGDTVALPVAICKDDQVAPVAIMRLEDLLVILVRLRMAREVEQVWIDDQPPGITGLGDPAGGTFKLHHRGKGQGK